METLAEKYAEEGVESLAGKGWRDMDKEQALKADADTAGKDATSSFFLCYQRRLQPLSPGFACGAARVAAISAVLFHFPFAASFGGQRHRQPLQPVAVQGWRATAYAPPGTVVPRAVRARALLSPFDSLVFHRPRTAALFGVQHRLEVYVPAPQRVHGYYVLLFLLGEHLVARVDLKADRPGGALVVRSAWEVGVEGPGAPGTGEVAAALSAELAGTAAWLGLSRVRVEPVGDLAPALSRAVG